MYRPDMPHAILQEAVPRGFSIIHEFRKAGRGGEISVIYRSHLGLRSLKVTAGHYTYEKLLFQLSIGVSRMNIVETSANCYVCLLQRTV